MHVPFSRVIFWVGCRREENTIIELTQEQRIKLESGNPIEVIDTETAEAYLLLRKDAFERLKAGAAEDIVCTSAEMLDRVIAEDDTNDPHLAELQARYLRRL